MMTYVQETLFGVPETVEIEQECRHTQEEINEYYKTHTLLETVRYFHCRPNKLNIDPELKKGRRGVGTNSFHTELQVVFFKTCTNYSNRAIAKMLGISHHWTITAIERRNGSLKSLFEEYMKQLGTAYGEYLLNNLEPVQNCMSELIKEAMSRKKIKAADLKEIIDSWTKLHTSIAAYIPREGAVESGDVDAKAQLMDALTDAIKAEKMDKATMESIYYQPDDESIPSDEQEDER